VNASHTTYDLGASDPRPEEYGAWIAVLDDDRRSVHPLPTGHPISVGRSHSCAIQLTDRCASRLHLTLTWNGEQGVELQDHGSRNGTRVDGALVRGRSQLSHGSVVEVGASRLMVLVGLPEEPDGERFSPVIEADMVAHAPAMLRALSIADRVARSTATVLLLGETGVGKEVVARRIHRESPRHEGPFVAVNASTIVESLAESILFGHERGAFTGAVRARNGVFEEAHGGTLFLDEVGELSLPTQARLLRVLETREVTPVGGTRTRKVDVRLVAATHRDLASMVHAGTFRADLLFRLEVVRIELPALRDRPEDILPLSELFLRQLAPDRPVVLSAMAKRALLGHRFPGNVRELRNHLERAVAISEADLIHESDLEGLRSAADRSTRGSLRDAVDQSEADAIVAALRACEGNQTRAAERLGISRRTLVYRIKKYGLRRLSTEFRER